MVGEIVKIVRRWGVRVKMIVMREPRERQRGGRRGGRGGKNWRSLGTRVRETPSLQPLRLSPPSVSLPPVLGQLLAACERRGGAEEVEDLLQTLGLHPIYSTLETTPTTNEATGQVSGQPAAMSDVLNKLYGGVSPLHVASEGGHSDLVKVLLEHGADPTLQYVGFTTIWKFAAFYKFHSRDSGGRVPYLVAREKSVRDCYRRFMGQWPKTHDYSLAQIPSPLTDQLERERREKVREIHSSLFSVQLPSVAAGSGEEEGEEATGKEKEIGGECEEGRGGGGQETGRGSPGAE